MADTTLNTPASQPDKRTHSDVESSPDTGNPPCSRLKIDTMTDFIPKLIEAFENPAFVTAVTNMIDTKIIQPLLEKIKSRDEKIDHLEKQVCVLQNEVDALEQYERRNAIRISLPEPEQQGEDTDQLVLELCNKIQV